MRLLIQRVLSASVTVNDAIVGQIDKGLLLFLGVHEQDTQDSLDWLLEKLLHLRIFSDEDGKFNLSIQDVGGAVLLVSQFTLYGTCTKGRRPEFTQAARPQLAEGLYRQFLESLRQRIPHVEAGIFGAKMAVQLINDGPVTLLLEHPPKKEGIS